MKRMWEYEIVPRLRRRLGGQVILSKTLKTIGVGESTVEDMVRALIHSTNPTLATYAKQDGVHLRMTAKADSEAEAAGILTDFEAQVRAIMGDNIYGVDDETMEGVIGALLQKERLTLATIESCTGGLFASTITDVPSSAVYFRGGLVVSGPEMMIDAGLDPEIITRFGTVSQEASQALARLARQRLGADVGVAIVGIAGPEQVEGKPAGTLFSSVDKCGVMNTSARMMGGSRSDFRRLATLSALSLLRRCLLGINW
jgi:nicotinamide-nucleotide amidase